MNASQVVTAHRLSAALAVLDEALSPPSPDRARVAALVSLARREAAELTGSGCPAAGYRRPGANTFQRGSGTAGNVIPFRRP